jgi:hypothetical protein
MPALLSLLVPAALAQAINVVAPTLPPRTAGGTPAAAAQTAGAPVAAAVSPAHGHPAGAAPGHGAQGSMSPGMSTGTAPAYGSAPAHGATPAYGSAPGYGSAPSYGAAPAYGTPGHGSAPAYGGAPGAARAPAAPSSALAARGGYAPSAGYGSAPPTNDAALAAMPVARSSAAGACRAEPSPDRQSVTLLGADALPRQHVPLGEFRVQQVIHSPDGRWAVALTKLRGQPQFAALTLDLARCAAANTVDLPAAAEDARFEADEAVLLLGGRERRVKLADARVR